MDQDPQITPLAKIRKLFVHYESRYQSLTDGGIAVILADKLNKYNPRSASSWSHKYILQLIDEDLPVSRYVQQAIEHLYERVILDPPDLSKYKGIYVGSLEKSERILLNSLTPEERKQALKDAANKKKAV